MTLPKIGDKPTKTFSSNLYLVYDVKPVADDSHLSKYDWDLGLIDSIKSRRQSAITQKGILLSEFMKGAQEKRKIIFA